MVFDFLLLFLLFLGLSLILPSVNKCLSFSNWNGIRIDACESSFGLCCMSQLKSKSDIAYHLKVVLDLCKQHALTHTAHSTKQNSTHNKESVSCFRKEWFVCSKAYIKSLPRQIYVAVFYSLSLYIFFDFILSSSSSSAFVPNDSSQFFLFRIPSVIVFSHLFYFYSFIFFSFHMAFCVWCEWECELSWNKWEREREIFVRWSQRKS